MNTTPSKRTIIQVNADNPDNHEERDSDGTEWVIGCKCKQHPEGTLWIQCTDDACVSWYCETWIQNKFKLSPDALQELRSSADIFKCAEHGLLDIKMDELGCSAPIVSHYNLRKKQRKSVAELESKSEYEPSDGDYLEDIDLDYDNGDEMNDNDDDLYLDDITSMSIPQMNAYNIEEDKIRVAKGISIREQMEKEKKKAKKAKKAKKGGKKRAGSKKGGRKRGKAKKDDDKECNRC